MHDVSSDPEASPAPAAADVPVGSLAEIRAFQERYKDGKPETITRDAYKPTDFDPSAGHALVFHEKFNEAGARTESTIRINSPHLLQLLRTHVEKHPSISVGFDDPFEMKAPFQMLFHHWPTLEALARPDSDVSPDQRAHLLLLLELMQGEMGKVRSEVESMKAVGQVTFDLLWAIYRPGDLVFRYDRRQPTLMRLDKTVYENDPKEGPRFEVHYTQTSNDGTGICIRRDEISIKERQHIGGGVPGRISQLPIYPYDCRDDAEQDLIPELQARGQRLAEQTGVQTVAYEGTAEYQRLPPQHYFDFCMAMMEDMPSVFHGYYESGRVVLDAKTYIEDFPFEGHKLSRYFGDEWAQWATKRFGSLEQANHALAVPWIYGFSLQRKQWCRFYMAHTSPVAWAANPAASLALPEQQKALVQALVRGHHFPANPREQNAQKGKGLVILLHGLPGSGKTLTAEVAAEAVRAPLLLISLANLYDGSYFEEAKLAALLRWGTIFQAIILIDEADVFLEARRPGSSRADTERNALVATFLRHLEYFSGIAFLTSNRVAEFDAAMKSRIHLALQYALPPREVRRQIWTARLQRVPPAQLGLELEATVEELIVDDMNGREIANAVTTALSLARHEERPLERRHLETVLDIWREFGQRLLEIEGGAS